MSIAKLLAKPRVSSTPIYDVEGTRLYARTLTGAEVAEYIAAGEGERGKDASLESGFRLVMIGSCDDKGVRVFADEELETIRQFPFAITRQLIDGISRHNGLDAKGEDDRKN